MVDTNTLEKAVASRAALADIVRAETVRVYDSLCAEPKCVLPVQHVGGHWRPGQHWWTPTTTEV